MNKLFIVLSILINLQPLYSGPRNLKYTWWQTPSYFRGCNVLYETPKTKQDFIDLKNYGGNLAEIGVFGFMKEDPPYDIQQANINGTDSLVNYCRQAGIYYILAIRSGPGAYDTYLESSGQTGESRIWNTGNTTEQNLYSNMLNMIVNRYGNDTLLAGIDLVVEPRPKVKYIPANTSSLYKLFLEDVYNIHMDQVYRNFISGIRSVNQQVPIIIENFAYSTPELFPAYVITDPYIVYSAHNYMPKEYTNADTPATKTYPGTYWNITYLAQMYYDKAFMTGTIFSRLKSFQDSIGGAPVIIGELGMLNPQMGDYNYLSDELDICLDYGWSFAIWEYRNGSGFSWNMENFKGILSSLSPWVAVVSRFHAPPVPGLIYPSDGEINISINPTFLWDTLTSYTWYDIAISENGGLYYSRDWINGSTWTYDGTPLQAGHTYTWKVRSKNPGTLPENWSNWSSESSFTIQSNTISNAVNSNWPHKYKLNQNYPNPFNPTTNINYELPEASRVNLVIYNVLGQLVRKISDEVQQTGSYSIKFDASSLPSGIYFYRFNAVSVKNEKAYTNIKKMILVK
jgi:hypothetical protein